jgi:hypothetical protein
MGVRGGRNAMNQGGNPSLPLMIAADLADVGVNHVNELLALFVGVAVFVDHLRKEARPRSS